MGAERFRRSSRLRSPKDFRRVSREGRRVSSRAFVLLWAPTWPAEVRGPRLGLTVSRSVGVAVVRNRVKRSIRGWFRRAKEIPEGRDLVVIARSGASELAGQEVERELDSLLARLRAQEA